MSYTQSLYHIVFRTYASQQTIDERYERDLYAYLYAVATERHAHVHRIGGMPDHIHLFVELPPTESVAAFVQHLKTVSSKWMADNALFPHFRGWAREYAALSYSIRDKEMITNYIRNQKVHHRKVTFEEEYRQLLTDYGIAIREEFWMKD